MSNLALTDWNVPVDVVLDDEAGTDRLERIGRTWRNAVQRAAEGDAEVTLLLEDDLDFNRYLSKNLSRWAPLRGIDGNQPFFGSLYNPGLYAVHGNAGGQYAMMLPGACWGAQALLVSRAMARYLLRSWNEEGGEPDLRMPRLAGRLVPVYYHRPSLVEHVGHVSTWGGRQHQSVDFDRDFMP